MKPLLLFATCLLAATGYSQITPVPGKPRVLTPEEEAISEYNKGCTYSPRHSLNEKNSTYPFYMAQNILLVSFDRVDSSSVTARLPLKNGFVDESKLKQIIQLSNVQEDSLFDLLMNNSYRGAFHTITENKCYDPHHAILFKNAADQHFAWIELCFECNGYETSSVKVITGDFCEGKYALLKTFFLKAGISNSSFKDLPDPD